MDATEARIRALQRIAYGADATDEERARAVADLVELAVQATSRDGVRSGVVQAGVADVRGRTSSPADAADTAAADEAAEAADAAPGLTLADPASNASTPGREKLVRWTVAAAAAGLLLGVAVGWGIGVRVSADSIANSTVGPSSSPGPATPLERTDLLPLFDRLPLAAESTRVAAVDATIDPASVRLLATRSDGPSAYLTRTLDGQNACLVLMLPAGPSSLACTIDGIVPTDGLRVQYYAQGYGLAVARLTNSGTVTLGLMVTF